jgi:hypothetical protein
LRHYAPEIEDVDLSGEDGLEDGGGVSDVAALSVDSLSAVECVIADLRNEWRCLLGEHPTAWTYRSWLLPAKPTFQLAGKHGWVSAVTTRVRWSAILKLSPDWTIKGAEPCEWD